MMLPLTAERPGDQWPQTLKIRLADDREFTGVVAWISRDAQATAASWTADPRRLNIRAVDRSDDTSAALDVLAGEGPYLLARLPDDGEGLMEIAGRRLEPVWRNVPWTDPLRDATAPAPEASLAIEIAPDRPDPVSPFEFWRWVLLADRLDLSPPVPQAPTGDDLQRLAAEHYAVLWRIGLGRLAESSRRVAVECRTMLTRTAVDRNRTVATWVTDPQQISMLLSALIDFSRSDQNALASAVAWLDQQPIFMLWPEDESGDQVRLAVTSQRDTAQAVQVSWLASRQPPSRLQLEPGIIAHISVDRMPLEPSRIVGSGRLVEPPTQTLRIESGMQVVDLPCGPRVTQARPPGVSFQPLTPPVSLADVQATRTPPALADRATYVQVRRLAGRWEVFFECRRNFEKEQALDAASLRTFDDLRGIEAVTILLGRDTGDGNPAVWLTIPEHDWQIIVRGDNLPDLQVHKRSFADRWHCRVVLPDQWFSAAETNPAFIGFIRSHGDAQELDTGPAPSPAWRAAPGRVALDLSHWDDLPTPEQ